MVAWRAFLLAKGATGARWYNARKPERAFEAAGGAPGLRSELTTAAAAAVIVRAVRSGGASQSAAGEAGGNRQQKGPEPDGRHRAAKTFRGLARTITRHAR